MAPPALPAQNGRMTTLQETKTFAVYNMAPSVQRSVDAITRAFAGDPAARWIWPNDRVYYSWFPDFVLAYAGAAFREGGAYFAYDYAGSALWLPPGIHPGEEAVEVVEKSVPAERLAEVFAVFEQMGSLHPLEPHWHLPLIGVKPEHQGEGCGSALMAPVLAQCDREGIPAYLEATNPKNLRLYRRLGFEAVDEIQAGPSVVITPMVRRPQ